MMQPYQLISGMWSIREPSCPEGPSRGYVWKAAGINAAKTGNDFWLDNVTHPWAISTEKNPHILPPAPPLPHDSQITHFTSPRYAFHLLKSSKICSGQKHTGQGRMKTEIHFLLTWWVPGMFSPIFRSQEKSSMLFGRGTVKSVMNIITKKFDTAASEKEIWHSRGSPHLCLENISRIHKIC